MAKRSSVELLKKLDFFYDIPDAKLRTLARNLDVRPFHKKELVSFSHAYRKYVHFLQCGHIKIFRLSEDGQRVNLSVMGPGGLFGDLPYDEEESDDFVEVAEALDRGILCSLEQKAFLEIIHAYPHLGLRLFKWMVLRFRRAEAMVEDLASKDAYHRICSFIKRYAEDFGSYRSGQIVMPKFLSQSEIAHFTATSRQTVASTLNALRREGILEFNRSTMTISHPEKLC